VRQFWEDWNEAAKNPDTRAIAEMRELLDFCGRADIAVPCPYTPEIHEALMKGLFACNSWLAVHQITDIFGLRERFNVPGAVGDQNWTCRVPGRIQEWDKVFKNEIRSAAAALAQTGRC
jgi:4-alpha-glucanotransferase